MCNVYGLLPVSVPFVTPLMPLNVMSAALNPVIGALKDKVNSVLVCEEAPLAVTLTKVTEIVGAVTVTVTAQVAVLWPSAVVTVITALPADTALTRPLEDTVATAALPLLHVTFLFVALDGAMVALKVSELPTVIVVEVLFRDTPVTAIALLPLATLTEQVAILLPS
jgi:hypothetical protein